MRSKLFTFNDLWIMCMTLFSTLQCHTSLSEGEKYMNRKLLQTTTGDSICKLDFIFRYEVRQHFPEKNSIYVDFQLLNTTVKDCFNSCDVSLESENKAVQTKRVFYRYDEKKVGNCVFENVPCGTYQIVIRPIFRDMSIPGLRVRTEVFSMTTDDCNIDNQDNNKINIIIFSVIGCVIFISVLCLSACKWPGSMSTCCYTKPGVGVNVYILYCSNNITKNKVSILRDFLLLSSFYNSVKTIEGDLPAIMMNPYKWINDALQEKDKDGNLNKIIFIETEDTYEEEEFEMENFIFSKFLDKFGKHSFWCFSHHSNVFLVQLGEKISLSKRFNNLIRPNHYYIPQHLTDLCLKLSAGSKSNVSQVKKNLRRIVTNHEIRHLSSDQIV